MQKTQTIHIGQQSFTLKELNTRQVWQLLNSEGEQLQFELTPETLSGASSPGRIDGVPM